MAVALGLALKLALGSAPLASAGTSESCSGALANVYQTLRDSEQHRLRQMLGNTEAVRRLASSETGVPGFEAWQRKLRTMPIVDSALVDRGVSRSSRVTLADGTRAIFKRQSARMSDPRAEVAAFRFDRLAKFGVVPPTVIREVEGELGSLQLFAEAARTADDVVAQNPAAKVRLSPRIQLFDHLVQIVDRHGDNFLVQDANGVQIAIDHSLTFDTYLPEPLPERSVRRWVAADPELVERLRGLTPQQLHLELDPYLDSARVNALIKRIHRFLAQAEQLGLLAPR